MLFNSFAFLALFGCFLPAYHLTPLRVRHWLLLVVSLLFYAAQSAIYVALLVAVAAVAYMGGLAIDRADGRTRRLALVGTLAVLVGTLTGFKYYNFIANSQGELLKLADLRLAPLPHLRVPVIAGLSFYVFSAISYVVDVYRKNTAPEQRPGLFLLYIAYFPKLLVGPLERAKSFGGQMRRLAPIEAEHLWSGLHLFLWGLFKKVVIADGVGRFVDGAYGHPDLATAADLCIATYFEAIQIYCDFSGYSDMAIGLSRTLGIDLMENFRRPYLSTSVSEFWSQRWHISLAHWFRDYLYFPLGGSRCSWLRQVLNVLVVFAISGLWHGPNWTFVVWGCLNGLYVAGAVGAERLKPQWLSRTERLPSFVRILVTFHLVLVTWVFFRASSVADAAMILTRLAGAGSALPRLVWLRLNADHLIMIAMCVFMFVVEWMEERKPIRERLLDNPAYLRWGYYYAVLAMLVVIGSWDVRQFVYMQF